MLQVKYHITLYVIPGDQILVTMASYTSRLEETYVVSKKKKRKEINKAFHQNMRYEILLIAIEVTCRPNYFVECLISPPLYLFNNNSNHRKRPHLKVKMILLWGAILSSSFFVGI